VLEHLTNRYCFCPTNMGFFFVLILLFSFVILKCDVITLTVNLKCCQVFISFDTVNYDSEVIGSDQICTHIGRLKRVECVSIILSDSVS